MHLGMTNSSQPSLRFERVPRADQELEDIPTIIYNETDEEYGFNQDQMNLT